jgi:xylulokinase
MGILGIDIGTSGCKGVALGNQGEFLAESRRGYGPVLKENPGEIDPQSVRNAMISVVIDLARSVRAAGLSVKALSFSLSGDEMVPVDQSGAPLANVIQSSDPRGRDELKSLLEQIPRGRLEQITGLPAARNFPLVRWLWWRESNRSLQQRTDKLLCWGGLASAWLGGAPVIDASSAARTMMFDLGKRDWSDEILTPLDIPRTLLPEIVATGTVIGTVSREIVLETGLDTKTQIVAGGFDQPMSAFGAGVRRVGQASLSLGTWEALTTLPPAQAEIDDVTAFGVAVGRYVDSDDFYLLATNPNGGGMRSWLASIGAAAEDEHLSNKLSEGPARLSVIPDVFGSYTPWMDRESSGSIDGITPHTTTAEIAAGFLESVGYDHRETLERLADRGVGVDEIRIVGGGARSIAVSQLKADSLGRTVTPVNIAEPAALAAAAVAGEACGIMAASAIIDLNVRAGEPVTPRESFRDEYTVAFERYRTNRRARMQPRVVTESLPAFPPSQSTEN